jgi:predicted DNA-binding antitoxin AbrB/MazE fold protein
MAKQLRARVGRGVLELLEDIDLPEGKEVTVTIFDAPSRVDKEAFRRSVGGWKGTIDAETLIKNTYADRLVSTRPVPLV